MHYDKDKIKEQITTSMIQDLVADLGGEPKPTDFGFIARTICHNHYGEGSHKLYYYENTKLFRCYTGCDSTFDIFELICKVHNLSQEKQSWTLYNGMQYVVNKLNLEGASIFAPDEDAFEQLSDWKIFEKYDRIKISQEDQKRIELKEYNTNILKHLLYLRIADWEDEGISSEVIKYNQIGFCPSTDQITIPHFEN